MAGPKKDRRQMKSASRLYAVQALFQMEASDVDVEEVRLQFEGHRFGAIDEGTEWAEGHVTLFRTLLERAVTDQAKIDQATDKALAEKWPIDRIDPTLRALFRAAGAELLIAQTPPKVVIPEFVDVARAFFDGGKEPGFVNGVLDHMARAFQPDAFNQE